MSGNLTRRLARLEGNRPAARPVFVWNDDDGPDAIEAATVAACAAAGVDRSHANIIRIGWDHGQA